MTGTITHSQPVAYGTSAARLNIRRCSSSPSGVNNLATDSSGYMCTNSFRALIAAWLHTSQRSRYGVSLSWSAMESSVKPFQ